MTKSSINKKILTQAYRDFFRPLSFYAVSKVNNAALSDDLVQTTFMKTWVYLQSKGDIDLMRAFLYHTLNGLIIDEYRKHKPLSLDRLIENGFEIGGDGFKKLDDIIDARTVASYVKELPKKYRSVVAMRLIEEMSLQEVSVIAHQSKNTTSAQVHRGVIRLRDFFVNGANRLAAAHFLL